MYGCLLFIMVPAWCVSWILLGSHVTAVRFKRILLQSSVFGLVVAAYFFIDIYLIASPGFHPLTDAASAAGFWFLAMSFVASWWLMITREP